MGLLLLLKFAFVCIDYLAWPVIALGYPLFASIRAVENDSKYHMKKLIIYWTLFSLISLFEFTFLKLIVWIPFWDSIRLIAIIWLVMPRFQGACHAYQILVRPVLSIDLRAVIVKLYKTNEDKYLMKATFLDVAEQYIKENGLEALERLIATKKECSKSERDVLVFEPEEKNDVATSEQVQYAETTPPDSSDRPPEIPPIKNPPQEWTCEICKVTTTSETTLNAHLQGSKHRSNCESLKGSKFHAEETRSSSSSDRPPEIPSTNNPPQEWTREICKVTTTSETTLNAHLQGSEHRSNCESLKRSKFHAEETRSSSSSDRPPEIPPIKNPPQEWTCEICKVTTTSETTLNAHLQGYKHRSNFESLKSSKFHAEDTISSSSSDSPPEIPPIKNSRQEWTCDICKVTTTSEATLNAHLQGFKHRSNCESLKRSKFHAEETRSSSSSDRPPEIPPIKKSRKEWACDICKVTTTSKTNLNAHLRGSKHRSNCESLKESKFHAGDTSPSSSRSDQGSGLKQAKPKQDGGTNQIFELYCNVCSLKLNSCSDLASHNYGKRHLSNITTMKQDGGTNQIFKLYCNVCSLKLYNSGHLASHIKRKQHLSNIVEISSTN
ncbi:hypothetical protein ACS0TY_002896 [Phlomoides rotata]